MAYTQRYVAFIDILGFSQIVSQTGQRGAIFDADSLVEILTDMGARFEEQDTAFGDDFKFQTFSDSIVMSEAASGEGFEHLTRSIRSLTIEMLSSGLLIRGGISKGQLHHDEKVMFGPAFLEAYRIESTIANYPRVVLSRDVYADFNRMQARLRPLSPRVRLADDGPAFVNMFELFKESRMPSINTSRKRRARRCHTALQRLLNESIHEPKHFEKLQWLANYWNSVAESWPDGVPTVVPPYQATNRR
jgi:hypothetical protein